MVLTLGFLLCSPLVAQAQWIKALRLSIFSESIALPFSRLDARPSGASVGIGFWNRSRTHSESSLSLDLGFLHHAKVQNSIYLKVDYHYTYQIKGWGWGVSGGIGYIHSFYPREVYRLDEQGQFESFTYLGKAGLLIDPGLFVSRQLSKRVRARLGYRYLIQYPTFSRPLSVMPHNLLELGTTINFLDQ